MKILFAYNSSELAGAENAIIRLSNALIKNRCEVYICESKKKIMHSKVSGSIFLELKSEIQYVDVLFHFASDVLRIDDLVNVKDYKLKIIWNIHPHNLHWNFPFVFSLFTKLNFNFKYFKYFLFFLPRYKKIFHRLESKKTLFLVMDGVSEDSTKALFPKLNKSQIFTIAADEPRSIIQTEGSVTKSLSILFLGRLVDYKVIPFINLLNDLLESYDLNFEVNVVGTGPSFSLLRDFSITTGLNLNFLGNLYDDDLHKVACKSSFCFAMGTSSLDMALNGSPVLLSPYSNDNKGKYIWLYEAERLNTMYTKSEKSKNIKKIICQLQSNRELIASKCQKYAIENYSIAGNASRLLEMIYDYENEK